MLPGRLKEKSLSFTGLGGGNPKPWLWRTLQNSTWFPNKTNPNFNPTQPNPTQPNPTQPNPNSTQIIPRLAFLSFTAVLGLDLLSQDHLPDSKLGFAESRQETSVGPNDLCLVELWRKCLGGGNSNIFLMFIPIWGRFQFWLIFFNWVETTN